MKPPATFYDVCTVSLTRGGEELCGDHSKVLRTPDQTIVVMADGMGSGVKAHILARLTTEIFVTMLRESASLPDVMETVTATLPTCKVRGVAYAAFVVLQIRHATREFRLVNCDCPPAFLVKDGQVTAAYSRTKIYHGKSLNVAEGRLAEGDFIGIMSDGVVGAGPGRILNPAWNWDRIRAWLQNRVEGRARSAEDLTRWVMDETQRLYNNDPGDDATFLGVLARPPRRLMVFTGPPADKNRDEDCVRRLVEFDGRKAVCGGTTGNLVADYLGELCPMDLSTGDENVPPISYLSGVDLLTEGILTLAWTLQLLQSCQGEIGKLTYHRNGAALLARELLQADSIFFLAGESVNPHYQNPMLPRSVSIRQNLVTQIAAQLVRFNKTVETEWC